MYLNVLFLETKKYAEGGGEGSKLLILFPVKYSAYLERLKITRNFLLHFANLCLFN